MAAPYGIPTTRIMFTLLTMDGKQIVSEAHDIDAGPLTRASMNTFAYSDGSTSAHFIFSDEPSSHRRLARELARVAAAMNAALDEFEAEREAAREEAA